MDPPALPSAPLNPQVEGKTNPTDVSLPNPPMTWMFNDLDVGDAQTAYTILIASSSDNLALDLGDVLDTGKILTSISSHTLSPITGGVPYYWKVKTWDSMDLEGAWCAEQTFAFAPNVPVELSIFSLD